MHTHEPRIPGLVIGGTGSGAGKTTLTLALLCALRARGLAVRAAKTGPDFIDAAFHAAVTGQPAANLDAWMGRETAPSPLGERGRALPPGLRRLLSRMAAPKGDARGPEILPVLAGGRATGRGAGLPQNPPPDSSPTLWSGPEPERAPDLLLVEGAMGLYDGGHRGAGSTALLAALLGLPILLVLNARGMGQSAAAVAEGFVRHCPAWLPRAPRFLGMVCAHVGGPRHAALLREALAPLEKSDGVPLLGLLPREGAPALDSRHLGLVEAREALPALDLPALGSWLENHCRVADLLRLAGAGARRPGARAPEEIPGPDVAPRTRFFPPLRHARAQIRRGRRPLRVGMAWDAAFSFCYADLPATLAELGAEIIPFSPLADSAPPSCEGLYFPGGYPELHAAALEANTAMRETLAALALRGLPMYGECGGYIYLMRRLTTREGRTHAMGGLLPQDCALSDARAALGYRAALALPGWPGNDRHSSKGKPLWARGHEFHYTRLLRADLPEGLPQGCAPLWLPHDSRGRPLPPEGCRRGSVAGSWLHVYPEGSRRFWRAWLRMLAAQR